VPARSPVTPELSALLDELHVRGATKVALHMAGVGGEGAFVVRCLTTPEAGAASGHAVRLGIEPERLAALNTFTSRES
jgi:hypothetical protein